MREGRYFHGNGHPVRLESVMVVRQCLSVSTSPCVPLLLASSCSFIRLLVVSFLFHHSSRFVDVTWIFDGFRMYLFTF